MENTDFLATPVLETVTGKFCYPKMVSYDGTISTRATLPKPLVIGTDVTITESGGDFVLDFQSSIASWDVQAGEYIAFSNSGIDGVYKIKTIAATQAVLIGPGQSVASGHIYFISKPQRIFGVNTKFKSDLKQGDYLLVVGLTPSVQVRKIVSIENETTLLVEKGFIGAVSSKPLLAIKENPSLIGVSIKCGGAGKVVEQDVATDDVITVFDENGIRPIYGDSGANTFKILIQSK